MTSTAPAPLVFADCETDGTHRGRQAWEVAFIRREPDGTERSTEFFIHIDMSTADPFGLNVGRFYDRHPLGRKLAGEYLIAGSMSGGQYRTGEAAAFTVAQWTHGAHIVGANPAFDTETFDPLLRQHGLIPAWHYHVIDVSAMALGYLMHTAKHLEARAEVERQPTSGPSLDLRAEAQRLRAIATPPYSSNELTEAIGVPPIPKEKRHTAMGDAEWARAMYDRMTGVSA